VIHSCSSFPFFLLLLLIQFLNEFHFSLVIRRCDSQVVGLRNRRFWTDLEGSHQRNSACGIRSQGQPSWWAIWLTNVFIVIHDSLLITFWLIWCSHLLCGFDDKDLGPAEWICVCEDSVWPWPQCILRGLSSLWWHPAVLFSWPVNQNLGNWNWVCELACTFDYQRESAHAGFFFLFITPFFPDTVWRRWLATVTGSGRLFWMKVALSSSAARMIRFTINQYAIHLIWCFNSDYCFIIPSFLL